MVCLCCVRPLTRSRPSQSKMGLKGKRKLLLGGSLPPLIAFTSVLYISDCTSLIMHFSVEANIMGSSAIGRLLCFLINVIKVMSALTRLLYVENREKRCEPNTGFSTVLTVTISFLISWSISASTRGKCSYSLSCLVPCKKLGPFNHMLSEISEVLNLRVAISSVGT